VRVEKVRFAGSLLSSLAELVLGVLVVINSLCSPDGMNPPPSQAMTADPSVVAAAVRVCDDVLLASPTLTFMPAVVSNVQLPKTITIPIANSAGMEVLTCIIEVPKDSEWNGSIVTAEGVCVARVWPSHDNDNQGILFWKPETHIEWGGEDFGQTEISIYGPKTVGGFHTQKHKYCCFCPDLGVVYAEGPADGIAYGEDVTTKRQDLFNLGLWFFPCIVGIACCLAASFYPMEFNIKNRAGENVGCITGDLDCQGKVNAHAPTAHNSKPISMHFRGMTLEQRRLGLVAALHYMSGNPNLLHGVGFGAGI